MIPFWIESSSAGRPYKFHSPIVTWSTRNSVILKFSSAGIPRETKSF